MTTLASVIGRGLLADRPAFGTEGRLYYATDSGILYRDSGAAWESIEGTTGGIGGAPSDATYITTTGNGTLSAEVLLSAVVGYGVAASRPAFGTAGRLYYATDTDTLSRDNGTGWDSVTLDWGQVTGKPSTFAPTDHDHATTGDGGVLSNELHDGYSQYLQITTPSNPPANSIRLYGKDVSGTATLFYLDEAGVEHELPTITSGGGGTGAPSNAGYVTLAAETKLSAEAVLGTAVIMAGVFASRPAAATAGRLYWATDTLALYRDTSSGWVLLTPGHDHTTSTDGGVLSNELHDGYSQYLQITTPSNPPSNSIRIYAKDKSGTATLYYLDEAGVEYELPTIGSGGSGAPSDAHYITTQAESGLSAEVLLSAVIGAGVASSRPVFGTAGRLYYATDTHVLSRDTGIAWVTIQVDWTTGITSIPSTFAPSAHVFYGTAHSDIDATDTPGNGEVLTYQTSDSKWHASALPAASTPGHAILDEGSALTQRTGLNFVGAGVNVTDDSGNDRSIVTIGGAGAASDIEVTDAALSLVEGDVAWRTTRKVLALYDGTRERALSAVGWVPVAWPQGSANGFSAGATLSLAANGGSTATAMLVPGHMLLRSITYRNPDTSLARSMEWRLYEDRNNDSNTLAEISGANGSESFTATVASARVVAVGSPPIYLGPGIYWLVIRNTHASNTLGIATVGAGPLAANMAQSKTLGSGLGSTLDFVAATWVKSTAVNMFELHGATFGQATVF